MKPVLLASTVLAAASAWSLQAQAQTAPAAPAAQPPAVLGEVVVTAERREQKLQNAAIAVTALGSAALEARGVTSQQDFSRIVPSVRIVVAGGGSTQASLRGVGNLTGNTWAEQAIAFNLDGVYMSRGGAIAGNIYDLDRVEILKGPQGTLYGRNATAGAINVNSRQPKLGSFNGYVEADVGNYDERRLTWGINLPLGDAAAIRFSGQRALHDGYFKDGYNNQDDFGVRGQLLWRPNDTVSVLLAVSNSDVKGKGAGAIPVVGLAKGCDFWGGPSSACNQGLFTSINTVLPSGAVGTLLPIKPDGFVDAKNTTVRGQIDWKTPVGNLTVLAGDVNFSNPVRHYAAGFRVDLNEVSRTDSLEVRLASPAGQTLSWVVGAYGFQEKAHFSLFFDQTNQNSTLTVPTVDTKTLAVFGQGTYKVTDNLRFVLGARYTDEKKSTDGNVNATLPGPFAAGVAGLRGSIAAGLVPPSALAAAAAGAGLCAPPQIFDGANLRCTTFFANALASGRATGKVGVEYDLSSTSLLYANVSNGFKGGGFFASQPPSGIFRPETLTAYTVGSKNRFMDNRLQINLEGFVWKYHDKQFSHLSVVIPTRFDVITENAGDATFYGLEVEGAYLATKDDLFNATVQYNHSQYDKFGYNVPSIAGVPVTACMLTLPVPSSYHVDCTGKVVANAPLWSSYVSYSHTLNLANDGNIVGIISARSESETDSGEEHLALQKNPAWVTEDFTVTYNSPSRKWSTTGYIYNLSDQKILSSSFVYGPIGPLANALPPRTYGVRVNLKF